MADPSPAVQLSVAWIGWGGVALGAAFSLVATLVTTMIVDNRSKLRNAQDKEAEWRSHAIEITKLDAVRLIELHKNDASRELEPLILEFLANYRDLRDLNTMSPKALYLKIDSDRIDRHNASSP